MSPFPPHPMSFPGLRLFMSYACHNYCEFTYANSLLGPKKKNQFPWSHLQSLNFTIFLLLLQQESLSLMGEEYHIVVPFMVGHSPIYYFLQVDQLRVSVLIAFSCRRKCHWWGLRDAPIYVHHSKEVLVALCPFSRIIVVASPLDCLTYLAQVIGSVNSEGHEFHLIEQSLDPVRKWLVALITLMPLLDQQMQCLVKSVIMVACGTHSWIKLKISIRLPQYAQYLPTLRKLSSSDEASRSVLAWFLHVLRLKFIGIYSNRGLLSNSEWNWSTGNSLQCLGALTGALCPATRKELTPSWLIKTEVFIF